MAGTTRREALLGLTTAAALVAIPAAVAAAGKSTVSRAAWDAALARWRQAERNQAEAAAKFDAAFARFEAMKPSLDMIDAKAFAFSFQRTEQAAIAYNVQAELENFEASRGVTWWGTEEAAEKRRAAIRSVGTFQDRRARVMKATRVSQHADACDAAGDAVCDAWSALMTTPAPDSEAFLFKLGQLIGEEGRSQGDGFGDSWSADLLDAAMSDARRLLSAGKA